MSAGSFSLMRATIDVNQPINDKVALRVAGVEALDKCRVRRSGLSHLVDIQVRVDPDLSVRAGHDIAHAVKDALLASAPHAISDVTVHIEPMK